MLDGLRSFAKSWPGKIMGAFLLVGVAGFGINNVIVDLGSNTVARVGDEEINSREFLRAYQAQANAVSQQMGSVPTASQAEAMGLPTAVLLGLSEGASLDMLANDFGLGVSDAKLGQLTREDPSFGGTLGNFDASRFSQVLQAAGWTEAEYFEARGDEARREQLISTLFAGAEMPAVASDLISDYASATRTIDFITLSETSIEAPAAPTEEELAAYLAEHQAEFRTVETRTAKLIDLSLASLAATKTISDEEIAAEYEATRANLTTPERRTLEQVTLTTPELVAQFEAGLAAGTDFATLATQAGLTPSSIGTLAQSEITDQALASAAFGLPENGFAILEGIGGQRAVHVAAIEPAGEPTLEEAREQIANRLSQAQARGEINDVLDQIEELRAAFQPIEQIADRFGLPVYELDITAGGSELAAMPNLSPEEYSRVAQAVFAANPDRLIPAVPLSGNAHVWFDLGEVAPARDQTLDEVRAEVEAAIAEERANNALLAKATEIVTRLENGEALADVGFELNAFPQLSSPFTRFGSEDGIIDSTLAAAAFAGGPDHAGSSVNEAGEVVVFQVVDVAEGTPLDQAVLDSITEEYKAGTQSEVVAAIREDAGLRINQQALTQLLVNNYGQ
ncbi:peptidylprolyl isomerase [Devosia sediminis]|uniref:SurA N-terminal domain-containing protein n=1 Tax=Devosia sediminis TaxID=2798801 RepID=A0A934IPE5_9HYPH|nr:peptidylprolyl isomerase [Devosia sediminis]MBJ3784403.1 SurA N-terminal domain-containing protein [Devosia sediminis]